jgi:hypothetical protein
VSTPTVARYQRGTGLRRNSPTGRFRPELLPPPRTFYQHEFGSALGRKRRGWAQTKCCFHDGHSKTSLSLNLNEGHFCCFSCGARGHDLIAFVRLRYKVDFVTAAKSLGAWDETGKPPKKIKRVAVGRDIVMRYVVDGTEYTARVDDDPKDFLDLLRRVKAEACDRLTEVGRGDSEKFEGEDDLQWQIAADSHQLIRNEELANG